MNEELESLQDIGAQKVYEKTHIPLKYVQSILHGSFEGFSKLQFVGFVSILEREYSLELSELRKAGLAYFGSEDQAISSGVFVTTEKKTHNKKLYIFLIFLLFIGVVFFSISKFSKHEAVQEPLDESQIETLQKQIESIEVDKSDINVSEMNRSETNSSENNLSVLVTPVQEPKELELTPEPIIEKSFKIKSKGKVWYGYIDLENHKHYQGTFRGEKEIDASKNFLLIFGHGYIDMYVNGELQKFNSREYVRFLYKDNKLKNISLKEFKKLNRGRKW